MNNGLMRIHKKENSMTTKEIIEAIKADIKAMADLLGVELDAS